MRLRLGSQLSLAIRPLHRLSCDHVSAGVPSLHSTLSDSRGRREPGSPLSDVMELRDDIVSFSKPRDGHVVLGKCNTASHCLLL